jgi:hypothetical protein
MPVLVLALALAGCGSSGSGDEVAVKATTVKFLGYLAQGNGPSACKLVTPHGQASLAAQVAAATQSKQALSCEQIVTNLSQLLPAAVRSGLLSAQVKRVTVQGTTASVQDSDITSTTGNLSAFLKGGQATRLRKVNGVWQIDG